MNYRARVGLSSRGTLSSAGSCPDRCARPPVGTVTFLFTDVEGSTRLLHELGAEAYAEALAEHRRVIREACARSRRRGGGHAGGRVLRRLSDGAGALAAARRRSEALAEGPIRVRMGVHTGTPLLADGGVCRRWTSTGRPASPRRATADRCWSRRHRGARRASSSRPRRAPAEGPVCARAHLPAR